VHGTTAQHHHSFSLLQFHSPVFTQGSAQKTVFGAYQEEVVDSHVVGKRSVPTGQAVFFQERATRRFFFLEELGAQHKVLFLVLEQQTVDADVHEQAAISLLDHVVLEMLDEFRGRSGAIRTTRTEESPRMGEVHVGGHQYAHPLTGVIEIVECAERRNGIFLQ
jgi:hypothetical protein